MLYHLLDLPPELLDNILLFVDAAKDLLHLALTCKFLTELIIPDYLNFIDICSPINDHNRAIWRTLKTYPTLAKRILKLYVGKEEEHAVGYKRGLYYARDTVHIKRHVTPDSLIPDGDPFILFQISLSLMENLSYLSLKQAIPVIHFHKAMMTIAKRCHQLRGLHVIMLHERFPEEEVLLLHALAFPCLTTFTLISCWGACAFCQSVFTRVVFGAPSLVNICVVSNVRYFSCPEFFTNGNWPNLRRLSYDGFFQFYPLDAQDTDLEVDIAVSFFQRHPSLECLYINDSHAPPLLRPGTFSRRSAFPSLRSLYLSTTNPVAFSYRLFHISNLEFLPRSSFGQLVSLRSCTLTTSDIRIVRSLAYAVPNLERLDLYYYISHGWTCPLGVPSHIYPEQCLCDKKSIRTIIAGLKKLTHLVLHLPEYCGIGDPVDFCDVTRILTKLRYLRLSDNPYLVERAVATHDWQAEDSIVYRFLSFSDYEPHHSRNWGDFYSGSYARWSF